MRLSRESIVALERHFVGTLSAHSTTWLEAAPAPCVVVAGGDALRAGPDAFVLDHGIVESPGEERHTVRVSNPGSTKLQVTLRGAPEWLSARWLDKRGRSVELPPGASARLELAAKHDVLKTTKFAGGVQLSLNDLSGIEHVATFEVRFLAHRLHPWGAFDFHGAPTPAPFDFGLVDPTASRREAATTYRARFDNQTSVPLLVSFVDLPPWLIVQVDGRERRGPAAGKFFERQTPFTATIRPIAVPRFLGRQEGVLRVQTNDPRRPMRSIELSFTATIEASRPFVRSVARERITVPSNRIASGELVLENWGRRHARLAVKAADRAIRIVDLPSVPPSHEGRPGTATVLFRIDGRSLEAGRQSLRTTLQVDGGEPSEVTAIVPVEAEIVEEKKPRLSPELVMALVSLLVLVFSIVVSAGGAARG